MKRVIILGLLLTTSVAFSQTKPLSFTINGKIDAIDEPASVVLKYAYQGKQLADTVPLVNGAFSFKGAIEQPDRGLLYIAKKSDNPRMMLSMGYSGDIMGRDGITLYLDKGAITITGKTLKTASIKGSKAHAEYTILQQQLRPVYDKLEAINAKFAALSKEEREGAKSEALMTQIQESFKEMEPIQDAFIEAHPDSYVSWNMVSRKSIIENPEKQKEQLYSFNKTFLESKAGQDAIKRLEVAFKTAIGQPAPLFTQNNTKGEPVSLVSLRGKYVLIDFWASWCGPCRAENPNVVKAYKKFKDKNFEILAVSLDDKHDNWVKAIQEDGLTWLHVSDLKGWKNEVAALYNVRAVPQNWLIDPNGVIVAMNLRGAELEEKLVELLK